jgi:SAM-dependent methyltransferase
MSADDGAMIRAPMSQVNGLKHRRDVAVARIGLLTVGQRRRRRQFAFAGECFRYWGALHNTTWTNERAVELPIAMSLVAAHRGKRMLEVGNVLGYYMDHNHDVVDKYESAPGVQNADVEDFCPSAPYDLIVCISTLEHVGWDEPTRDDDKPMRALEHLAGMLATGGTLLVTVPLGHNPNVDLGLRDGRLSFDDVRYLRRLDRQNRWAEVPADEVVGSRYGSPYPWANAIAIGTRTATAARG